MIFSVREEEDRLDEMLRRNPDAVFICDEYIAMYSSVLRRCIVRMGNYMSVNAEQLNLLLKETRNCLVI